MGWPTGLCQDNALLGHDVIRLAQCVLLGRNFVIFYQRGRNYSQICRLSTSRLQYWCFLQCQIHLSQRVGKCKVLFTLHSNYIILRQITSVVLCTCVTINETFCHQGKIPSQKNIYVTDVTSLRKNWFSFYNPSIHLFVSIF